MERSPVSSFVFFLLLILAVCCLLYGQVFVAGNVLYFRDIYHNYFAFLDFIGRSLRAGDLPLWNPYLFGGTPQLAGLEPPIFYPLGWIFFLGLPFPFALVINLSLHHLLAGAGVYLLGRAYGWRWFSAALSGCLFSFSGVMVSMNNFHPLQNTVAWLPLVFWAAHRLLTRQGLRDLAVFGLVYGLQLLSGHLEIVYFETLLLLAYGAALLLRRPELRRWRSPGLALGAGLLALGLSAIQILPALMYLSHSTRQGGLDAQNSMVWSLHPFLTLLLLLPEQSGNVYQEASLNVIFGEPTFGYRLFFLSSYLGVLTWGLVLAGLSCGRQLGARFGFFVAVFAASLLLAYGKFMPFYHWLLALPGASFFRYPSKLLVFATFALVMAAGGVSQALLAKPALIRRLMLMLGLLGALALSAWLGFRFAESPLKAWFQTLIQAWRPDVSLANTETWSGFFVHFFKQQLLGFTGLCLLFGGLCWLLLRRRDKPQLALGLLLLAVNLDLLASGINSLWMVEGKRFEGGSAVSHALEARQLAQRPQERMLIANMPLAIPDSFAPELMAMVNLRPTLYQYQSMENNFSLVHGFRNLYGLWPARSYQSEFIYKLYEQAIAANPPDFRFSIETLNAVRYVLTINPRPELAGLMASHPAYRMLDYFADTEVTIWENQDWLPRARFQNQAMVVKQREQMITAMSQQQQTGFDPRKHLLLLDDAALAEARRLVPAQEAKDKRWTEPNFVVDRNNRVEVSFETNTSGYLVLADQNLPGWKAYDNGREVPILLANYMQRAVRVGPGQHTIRFEYQAPGFALGAAVSALSAFLLLCLFGLSGCWQAASAPLTEARNDSHVSLPIG